MKKILSFALVLALVLASVATCFAGSFSDAEGKDYEKQAEVLAQLGVLNGYTDGTFGGDKNITRAEYVAIIVRALGFNPTAGTSGFKDAKGHWADAYIAYGKDLGIVNGYNATTFGPNDKVTYDQAIAFTVRALGYKDETLALSVSRALGLGLLTGVPTGSTPATRGDVAKLVYAAAGKEIVKTSSFGIEQGTKTTMFNRLGGYVTTVAITAETPTTVNLVDYIGKTATVVKKTIAGTDKVLAVVGTATAYTGTFERATLTVKIGETKYEVLGGTYLKNNVACNRADLDGKTVYVEGTMDAAAKTIAATTVLGWVAEADKKVTADDIKAYKAALPKTSGAVDTLKYVVEGVDSFDDIAVGNVVTAYKSGSVYTKFQVGTKTEVGKFTSVNGAGTKGTINGTTYDFASTTVAADAKPASTTDQVAYFNYAGKIAFVTAPTVATVAKTYALVLATSAAYGLGNPAQYQLKLQDNTTVIYDANATKTTTWNKTVQAGALVEYAVDGTTLTKITPAGFTFEENIAPTKVAALGTIDGHYLADNVFVLANPELASSGTAPQTGITTAAIFGGADKMVKGSTYDLAYVVDATTNKITFVEYKAAGSSATVVVGLFNGFESNASGKVVTMLVNGVETKYVAGTALAAKLGDTLKDAATAKKEGLYTLTFNADGTVADMECTTLAFPANDSDDVYKTFDAATVSAVSADGLVITAKSGKISVSNPAVFKFNATTNAWEASDVATVIATTTATAKVTFLDLGALAATPAPDYVFDVIYLY